MDGFALRVFIDSGEHERVWLKLRPLRADCDRDSFVVAFGKKSGGTDSGLVRAMMRCQLVYYYTLSRAMTVEHPSMIVLGLVFAAKGPKLATLQSVRDT